MTRENLRLALPAIILASLLLLPFLDRPFTIDDPLFIRAAEHTLTDPLHPGNFEQVWNAGDRRLLSQYWLGGTLPAYLLVPVAALGSREWIAHLYQWWWLCVLLMGSVSVARRMGCDKRQANIVGLLVGSNPVTLMMSATCMPDVMGAAFGVWGIDRALAFREEHRAGAGVASGVLLAAGVLCRGNAVVLLIVVAMRLGWKRCWPVAIAVAFAGGWLALEQSPEAAFTALTGFRNVPRNLISFLAFEAMTGPVLMYALLSAGWRKTAIAAGVIAVGVGLSLLPHADLAEYAVPAALGLCFCAACGLLVRDAALAIWLCAGLAALPYVQMSAKYLLPGVPAAALLIVLHGARVRHPRYPLTIAILIALGWISGAAIIVGDTTLADSQRRIVVERIAPAVKRGRTVWAGGQWAFLHYAQRAGAKPLGNTPPLPQSGDTVVISRLDYYGRFKDMPFPRELVSTSVAERCGIFVLNRQLAAGFFSNRFGSLPFSVGCAELNGYEFYQIR
jgi:hypothetical protein